MPTWAPFRLHVYFNGHYWLASHLDKASIGYQMADNAFLRLDDVECAQAMAERFDLKALYRRLERCAPAYCPMVKQFRAGYHWSLMQVELFTDILFHRPAELRPPYEALVRNAVHVVKADTVATFLGRKPTVAYSDEFGKDFHTRIQGTRIRHSMGPTSSASSLNLWIQTLQFGPSLGGGELPVDALLLGVAFDFPGLCFLTQGFDVWDPSIKRLPG